MYNRYPGCYIRIPFQINEALQDYDFITLRIRYDDGFVAYINGTEVQRALASGTPRWNSLSSGSHEAGGLQDFDITEHADILKEGDNILAIHGLNTSLSSSDFLVSAEIVASRFIDGTAPRPSETAIPYNQQITLNNSTQVKARIYTGNEFSALNEAVYTIGPN